MLAALAYAVAVVFGLYSTFTFYKSVYHQWAKRGTTSGLFVNTLLSMASGGIALGAFLLALHLQSI